MPLTCTQMGPSFARSESVKEFTGKSVILLHLLEPVRFVTPSACHWFAVEEVLFFDLAM